MYVFFLNKFTLNTCRVFEFGLLINGYLLLFYCQNYTDNVMTCPTSFGPDHPVVYKELQKSVGRTYHRLWRHSSVVLEPLLISAAPVHVTNVYWLFDVSQALSIGRVTSEQDRHCPCCRRA